MEDTPQSKTAAFYDTNARRYSESLKTATRPEAITEFLTSLKAKGPILDAGCGDGRYTAEFAKQGAEVTGLDLSAGMLEVARDKFPEIDFIQGDITRLPFDDASFAGIWAHASLVHLETIGQVQATLAEFSRVLMLGGGLHIKVKTQTGENETEVVSDTLSQADRFFRYYTEPQLRELLEAVGFTVTEAFNEEDGHGRSEVKWMVVHAMKK